MPNWLRKEVGAAPVRQPTAWQQPVGQSTHMTPAFHVPYNGQPATQDNIVAIPANNAYSANPAIGHMINQSPPVMTTQKGQPAYQPSPPITVIDLTEDEGTQATPPLEVTGAFSVPIALGAISPQASSVPVTIPTPPKSSPAKTAISKPSATTRKRKSKDKTAPTSAPKVSKNKTSKRSQKPCRPLTGDDVVRSNSTIRTKLGRIDRYAWQVEGRAAVAAATKPSSSAPPLVTSGKRAKGFLGSELFDAFADSVQQTEAQRKERKKARKSQTKKATESIEVVAKAKQSPTTSLVTPISQSSKTDGIVSEEEPEQPAAIEQPSPNGQSSNLDWLFEEGGETEENEEDVNKRTSAFFPVPEEGDSEDDGGLTTEWDPEPRKCTPAPAVTPPPTKRAPKKGEAKPKKLAAPKASKDKVTKTRGPRGPYNTAKRRLEAAASEKAAREETARRLAEKEVASSMEADLDADLLAALEMEMGVDIDMADAPVDDLEADLRAALEMDDEELSAEEFESDEDETEAEAAARRAKYERRRR